jgi:hypothetical protein
MNNNMKYEITIQSALATASKHIVCSIRIAYNIHFVYYTERIVYSNRIYSQRILYTIRIFPTPLLYEIKSIFNVHIARNE